MTETVDIKNVFWKALRPSETPGRVWTDSELWSALYDHGFVDPRRLPKNRWMDILKQLPSEQGQFALGSEHLEKLSQFLYSGPLKRPFDPQRLKDGPRPVSWVQEMYQKVFKFETNIKPAEWNQIVQGLINRQFLEKDQYRFDQDFKDFPLSAPIGTDFTVKETGALGFSGHLEIPGPDKPKPVPAPAQKAVSTGPKDRFENSPEELKKIRSIEKLYYHSEKGPVTNDKETLDFLDELNGLDDNGEELK